MHKIIVAADIKVEHRVAAKVASSQAAIEEHPGTSFEGTDAVADMDYWQDQSKEREY